MFNLSLECHRSLVIHTILGMDKTVIRNEMKTFIYYVGRHEIRFYSPYFLENIFLTFSIVQMKDHDG